MSYESLRNNGNSHTELPQYPPNTKIIFNKVIQNKFKNNIHISTKMEYYNGGSPIQYPLQYILMQQNNLNTFNKNNSSVTIHEIDEEEGRGEKRRVEEEEGRGEKRRIEEVGKEHRITSACLLCRARKRKCDGQVPCSYISLYFI